uniref:SAM domain-containing protein n=1 Tax=Fundulus heteroclitus TaxID=8078 RepID=A0A3Q2P667_FUNHE
MQMAVSRVINLQHHRIAQVPAYLPTCLPVCLLTCLPAYLSACLPAYLLTCLPAYLPTCLPMLVGCGWMLVGCWSLTPLCAPSIREVAQFHHSMEQELAHAVNASSKAMDVVYAKTPEALSCSSVVHMVSDVKALLSETELLLAGKMSMQLDPPQQDQLNAALGSVAQELRRLSDVPWLCPIIDPLDQEGPLADFSKRSQSGKFRLVSKFKKDKNNKNKEMCATLSLPVHQWGTEEVGAWLDFLCLSEYKDIFTGHDVRGAELIHLERRDLKDLGVTKVGHIKRILQGIKELMRSSSASEA